MSSLKSSAGDISRRGLRMKREGASPNGSRGARARSGTVDWLAWCASGAKNVVSIGGAGDGSSGLSGRGAATGGT